MCAKSNQNPEQIARDNIDVQLRASGWAIQGKDEINFNECQGQSILKRAFTGQLVPQNPPTNPPPTPSRIQQERSEQTKQDAARKPKKTAKSKTAKRP